MMINKTALTTSLLTLVTLGRMLAALQQEVQPTLESKIKAEMLKHRCIEACDPPLMPSLLKLADAPAISAELVKFLSANKTAKPGDPDFKYLFDSISVLGELRARAAVPLLLDIANCDKCWDLDMYHSIRINTVHSIGEIDPVGNREFLLTALKDDYYTVRREAAQGLSKTGDPSVLPELDVQAAHEMRQEARQEIQSFADSLRAAIRAKKQ